MVIELTRDLLDANAETLRLKGLLDVRGMLEEDERLISPGMLLPYHCYVQPILLALGASLRSWSTAASTSAVLPSTALLQSLKNSRNPFLP